MLGFVKSEKTRNLGGEVIRIKKRKRNILLFIVMLTGFLLVNFVLYYISKL